MSVTAVESQPMPDAALVEALRRGDEDAFLGLVARLHAPMLRFARGLSGSDAAAEDSVQDTWAAVLQNLHGFEGRSPVRSWIFGILANQARTRASRDGRVLPLSSLGADDDSPAVDPAEFLPDSHPRWPGHWVKWPEPWPDEQLLSREMVEQATRAIAALPEGQRAVIQLRDVEGWSAGEVCEALGLSEVNQRVLLHRARSRVRRDLDRAMKGRQP